MCFMRNPCGPSDRLWGRLAGEGVGVLGMRREAAGSIRHPAEPGLALRGYHEERRAPVSPASHSSQNRLAGQAHEVSRWNQESRRAKARTLGQSCFSRVKATAPLPPTPSQQPGRMGPFELPG